MKEPCLFELVNVAFHTFMMVKESLQAVVAGCPVNLRPSSTFLLPSPVPSILGLILFRVLERVMFLVKASL
jgi:hypothetical protein